MSLELLAQQYLPITPRHVALLTTDGSGGNPAAVVAVSSAFDPKNRLFFFEWDDPKNSASFRLTHVSVPGNSINAISLMLSPEGVVHCVVQSCSVNFEGMVDDNSCVSCVFRREESEEEEEEINGTNDDDNYRIAVTYRRLPKSIEDDDRIWTTALRLYRGGNSFGSGCGEGRVMVACGGEKGETNALKLLRLNGTRMSVQQKVELRALPVFPVLQMREIDGDASSMLLLCHHDILEVDTRMKESDSVVRAWKWTPHDPLITFAVKDNTIVAGSEDGVLIVWDLRYSAQREKSSVAVDHSRPCGGPVTGLHMPHSTSVLSCHADGSVLAWDSRGRSDDGFIFAPHPASALPPVFVGTPGCVTLVAEEHLAVVADESGTLSVFFMS